MKMFASAMIILTALFAAACYSGPVEISEGLTPEELIQRAQEASDRNRYNVSLQYSQAILERFPSNIDMICAAEYEIAFIHYKQKKYGTAKEEFNALLSRYDTPDEELLPQQFKRLSYMVLERIETIELQNPLSILAEPGNSDPVTFY
jgi:outer membrane protein assembly factor BamD (BamD/ComL family)